LDKRTLFALILIFAIFWLSNRFLWQRSTPDQSDTETVTTEMISPQEPYNDEESYLSSMRMPEDDQLLSDRSRELFDRGDIQIRDDILLENDLVELYFSNRGGVLNAVHLKNYFHYDKFNLVNLIPEGASIFGLEMETVDDFYMFDDYVFNWENTIIDNHQALIFYLENQGQRLIEKKFVINDDYALTYNIQASGLGNIRDYVVSFNSGIADTEEKPKHKNTDYRFIGQIQNSRNVLQLRRIQENIRLTGNVDWAAIRSKYFIMVLLPEQRLLTDNVTVFVQNESPAFDVTITPGRAISQLNDYYDVYLGPLDYQHLKRYGIGLEETIEMGWKIIRPVSRLFLWLLTTLNKFFGNYGVTIIFFALILKIILYPLTHKSFESSIKMQRMSPHMQEIQKKYKSDPKQMQVELQKLYKEHGVNPLGGCLPLLLQMPIFFALYPVLRYSIELRQASFMLWLTDLSEPSNIILPALMGIFMFIQQKMMMPKHIDKEKMDEKQLAQMQSQKMMLYIMPVFLVFIFSSLPSGLVLYWTVFNVFSIIQQYYVKKKYSH